MYEIEYITDRHIQADFSIHQKLGGIFLKLRMSTYPVASSMHSEVDMKSHTKVCIYESS